MAGRPPPVTPTVQKRLPPPDTPALTGQLAAALQRAVDHDAGLRAGWMSLQRADVVLQGRGNRRRAPGHSGLRVA